MLKTDVKNFAKSFTFAFKGISYCVKNELNMRVHISMAVIVSYFSYIYKATQSEYLVILLCIGLVMACEMLNTAIETLTNLESPCYNNLAKISKDVAAGAVLISAIVAFICGVVVFLKPNRLYKTYVLLFTNPLYLLTFIAIIILSIIFIFNGVKLFGEPKTKIYHMRNNNKKKPK